jgi:hypothetical protein
MASRHIPGTPGTTERLRKASVRRELITEVYGPARGYGPCPHSTPAGAQLTTGGSVMTALLGPDLGDGQRRGSATNGASLQPLMGLLRAHSPGLNWIAGHLLNAELGGSGVFNRNLTPLTGAANHAHSAFEGHIKRMLILCNQIDRAHPGFNHWYGVRYQVTVSTDRYAAVLALDDMHSYSYSHIELDYQFVLLPKFPIGSPPHLGVAAPDICLPVPALDPKFTDLQRVLRPTFAPSVNIENWMPNGTGTGFRVQIHNEP